MKQKIISVILVFVMAFMIGIFPVSAEDKTLGQKFSNTSSSIVLTVNIEDRERFLPGDMLFKLYTADKRFLSSQTIWAFKPAEYKVIFNFAPTVLSDTVYVKLSSSADRITVSQKSYNVNDMIPLSTLGNDGAVKNEFRLSVLPKKSSPVKIYLNGESMSFHTSPKLIGNVCMVPLFDYISAVDIHEEAVFDKDSEKITVSSGKNTIEFLLYNKNVKLNGKLVKAEREPMIIKDTVFVPLRLLTEGLGGTVEASKDKDGALVVRAELLAEDETAKLVNERNIQSRTDYLIWISKSEYKVRVFNKVNGKWKSDREFDCSIGAKRTPTITGEYEYFSKEKQWSYPGYYVAPIMRFYRGYALHSTLIKYDGTAYDDTVGAMISHGCIRLHPDDIGWLADNIPLYTKIYITD